MEIPDKLYLSHLIYGTFQYQVPDPDDDTQVEYIRKDAFIKKAAAYLNEKFYFNNLHYAVENNTFNCMEELFEDFKEYMEEL